MKTSIKLLCLLAAMSLGSCKKIYVCYCKSYGSGAIAEYKLNEKMTRSRALDSCTKGNYYVRNGYSCGLE